MDNVPVLIFEPDHASFEQLSAALGTLGCSPLRAESFAQMLELLFTAEALFAIVALDQPSRVRAGLEQQLTPVEALLQALSGRASKVEGLLLIVQENEVFLLGNIEEQAGVDFITAPCRAETLAKRIALVKRRAERSRERRQADEAARLREERFRALHRDSPIGILVYDERGNAVEMNPAAMRMFGLASVAQVPNIFQSLRIFPDPSAALHAQERFANGETFRYQFPVNFEHGMRDLNFPTSEKSGTIYIELCITPIARDIDGKPQAFLAQVQDVTDRTLAERSLEASYQNMRRLLDSMPECVAVYRHGELLYVNEQGLSWCGKKDPGDVRGERVVRFLRAENSEAAAECLEQLEHSSARAKTCELRATTVNGEAALLEVMGGPPIEYEGAPAHVLIARDISERKRLEGRLFLADRMASLGTMAAGVAHEINNPLSYVIANVGHVMSEIVPRAEEGDAGSLEMQRALEEALGGLDRIRRIVADLKTFSRSDDERAVTSDVRRVLDSCVNIAASEIRHRAKLVREYTPVPPVRGSDARLGQVFLNLLVNAAQALPVGQVHEHEIKIRTSLSPDGRIVVEIADTGMGIPPEVLPKIFDPFFTTKPVGEGTGLGLSICHAIIKAIGGEISVQSTVGRGTTMRVMLQAAGQAADSFGDKRKAQSAAPSSRRRILVVDDEPLFALAVRRLLQAEHEVTVIESGRSAIELLQQKDFDVVLCDLMMPDIGGIELYGELSKMRPGFERRMAFMTGGAFTQAARKFLESVPNARLEKPFTREEARAVVRLVIGEGGESL